MVYSSFGTASAVQGKRTSLSGANWQEVRPGRPFTIGAMQVLPVLVPHDAREPCQYRFSWQGRTLGVLTDLGAITPHVNCDLRRNQSIPVTMPEKRESIVQSTPQLHVVLRLGWNTI